jgi:quercetin dioxygenase-like cupin family protein
MNLKEYIASGIIETYCLGFTSAEENELLEKMAGEYPEVQQELQRVRTSLDEILKQNEIRPAASVKTAVMNNIYRQQAIIHPEFVPLMHEQIGFERFFESAKANKLKAPASAFENLFVLELPSTPEIINFAVWAKKGHEEESHSDRKEFIAILDGSCDMFMNGEKTSYSKGSIIDIPVDVPHYAVITSEEPMFALVQRQLIGIK